MLARTIFTAVAAAYFAVAASVPVSAQVPDPVSGPLMVNLAGHAPSPSGCTGRSDYPHRSGHISGNVNAASVTMCLQNVPSIHASGQLWQNRWFGFEQVGTPGSSTKYYYDQASAFSYWECRDNLFRVTSYHESKEGDGNTYALRTANSAPVVCGINVG